MIRYRIDRDLQGQHVVLPALPGLAPFDETYATRAKAQGMAGWPNQCQEHNVAVRVPVVNRRDTDGQG